MPCFKIFPCPCQLDLATRTCGLCEQKPLLVIIIVLVLNCHFLGLRPFLLDLHAFMFDIHFHRLRRLRRCRRLRLPHLVPRLLDLRPRPRNRRRWTFVELKHARRDIILVYAVGEDGSTVNGDNMFMSGCTLMAIISFP